MRWFDQFKITGTLRGISIGKAATVALALGTQGLILTQIHPNTRIGGFRFPLLDQFFEADVRGTMSAEFPSGSKSAEDVKPGMTKKDIEKNNKVLAKLLNRVTGGILNSQRSAETKGIERRARLEGDVSLFSLDDDLSLGPRRTGNDVALDDLGGSGGTNGGITVPGDGIKPIIHPKVIKYKRVVMVKKNTCMPRSKFSKPRAQPQCALTSPKLQLTYQYQWENHPEESKNGEFVQHQDPRTGEWKPVSQKEEVALNSDDPQAGDKLQCNDYSWLPGGSVIDPPDQMEIATFHSGYSSEGKDVAKPAVAHKMKWKRDQQSLDISSYQVVENNILSSDVYQIESESADYNLTVKTGESDFCQITLGSKLEGEELVDHQPGSDASPESVASNLQ